MPTYVSANIDLDYVENLVKILIECQHPPTQEEALASCVPRIDTVLGHIKNIAILEALTRSTEGRMLVMTRGQRALSQARVIGNRRAVRLLTRCMDDPNMLNADSTETETDEDTSGWYICVKE